MANLANKYRPKTWEDVCEQGVVVDILKSLCEADTLDNRNFLFTGSAGIGKTSLARIIGNTLNDGQGEFVEIDAASHNGVDSMRNIVKQAQQYPVGSKYKIFILDEVHVLSSAAWQALLKVLEEGPAKSVFILCTTNPERIPATIISRVQVFRLSRISLAGITARLKHVLDCEINEGRDIKYDEDAVEFIAKLANGGMRDALTLLDKALAFSGNIDSSTISSALDLPNYSDYFDLLQAYAKKDNSEIAKIVDKVYNSGTNFVKWFEGFHSFTMNVLKYTYLKDIRMTLIPAIYESRISGYTSSHSFICLKLGNRLIDMNHELKSSEYLQEVALTYLCSYPNRGK